MPITIATRRPDHLDVPEPLQRLVELSYNAWWTWNRPARRLFDRLEPDTWARYRNPVLQLLLARSLDLHRLAEQEEFILEAADVLENFDTYMAGTPEASSPVAYVSAEYGLHESLPIYSGGLGVLSGDHLKEASDLAIPMVGVGLFYRRGYFRQLIDPDGSQQHLYPDLDALRLPILRVAGPDGRSLRVPVDMPGRRVWLRVWVTWVGRVPLLLLDSYTTHNAVEDRYITSQLYVTGRQMRLEQEVVLGRGAVAALAALEIVPSVWHMNEGHSAFLALENLTKQQGSFEEATAAVRTHHVFTTHTPVPAGNEVFDADMVRPFLDQTAETMGAETDQLMALGAAEGDGFNLTALALRLSCHSNAVSKLHGEVSRGMWPDHDIDAVTNGIHVATWLGPEFAKILAADGNDDPYELSRRAETLDDQVIWAAHLAQKHRLMRFVRVRLTRQMARHGRSPDELRRVQDMLDPGALTIGFARRFAPYKRADLLFHDPERLAALLANDDRPVQLLIAGKAHPADKPGQEIIRRIWEFAQRDDLLGRVVGIEDYDMSVARLMVRGVDIWLNTPEWGREASGTSGMKAGVNGVLNASVPDGWWAEVADMGIGFTIGDRVSAERERDAGILLELLENDIVPTWSERGDGGLPRRWIGMMRATLVHCLREFSMRRMLLEYDERIYSEHHPA